MTKDKPGVRVDLAILAVVVAILAAGPAAAALGGAGDSDASPRAGMKPAHAGGLIRNAPIVAPPDRRPLILPGGRRVRKAFRWARHRAGLVSIAVIDTAGRMRRMKGRRLFVSASVSKAVM